MFYRQTEAPESEPLALGEAKRHTAIDHKADDAILRNLIKAAREQVEAETHRQLVTATWQLTLDHFPRYHTATIRRERDRCECHAGNTIYLERPPIQQVTSIKYIDTAGVQQTLATSEYQVDAISEPGRIKPAFGKVWPATRFQMNAVTVEFTAGYGAGADVPEAAREAMLLLVGHWYLNREAVGQVGSEIELAYCSLISSLKWGLQ